jgi:hypothetical protein
MRSSGLDVTSLNEQAPKFEASVNAVRRRCHKSFKVANGISGVDAQQFTKGVLGRGQGRLQL